MTVSASRRSLRSRTVAVSLAAVVLTACSASPSLGRTSSWWSHQWRTLRQTVEGPSQTSTVKRKVQREQVQQGATGPGLPEQPADQVTFAQMTDKRPLDLSRTGGDIGFVWGGSPASANGLGSRYYPIDRDLDRGHTADWYASNAPDQIVYQCDHTTPASLYTYSWGAYSPVDTSNPAVRQYIIDSYIAPALAAGQRVIALDNVSLRNDGHRCGVFRNGSWVQLYSGESRDPAFSAAVMDWVKWLADQIHARGGLLALNAKVDADNPDQTRKLIALGDIWLEEAGNARGCSNRIGDALWRTRFDLSRWAGQSMGWVSLEKTCAMPDALDTDEAQWVVGNFLLSRGSHSYLGAVKDGVPGSTLRYPATLNPPVGAPTGPAAEVPGGGWARPFTKGLVIVNPSSTAPLTYNLPEGAWNDLDGQPLSGAVTLAPTTARVIIRAAS